MLKTLIGASALAVLFAGAAQAQSYYGAAPRAPYATGAYIGVGVGSPDCSFTLVGAHAGVTVLGINAGAGARIGLPGGCRDDGPDAYARPVAQPYRDQAYYSNGGPPPPPYGYQGGGYGYQGGYQGGYAAPVAYPQPSPYPAAPTYGYGQPCGCQPPVVYQPY
jgi:hypothetical protein